MNRYNLTIEGITKLIIETYIKILFIMVFFIGLIFYDGMQKKALGDAIFIIMLSTILIHVALFIGFTLGKSTLMSRELIVEENFFILLIPGKETIKIDYNDVQQIMETAKGLQVNAQKANRTVTISKYFENYNKIKDDLFRKTKKNCDI